MTYPPGDEGGSAEHGGPAFRIPTAPDVPHGLGRNLNHDPRSKRFVYRAPRRARHAVRHRTRIPQLDQNGYGACTFFALLRVLGSEPYYSALQAAGKLDLLTARYPFTNEGGLDGYGDATERDPFPGAFTYPPAGGEDTGSDGTTCSKIVRDLGVIPGWQSTFTLDSALDALMDFPLYFGSVWTYGMFDPDALGRIAPTGGGAGGHEYAIDEFIPAGQPPEDYEQPLSATEDFVGIGNSWNGWGVDGRAFISTLHFGWLYKAQGDVIVLTPPTAPAPVPDPIVDVPDAASPADRAFIAKVGAWADRNALCGKSIRRAIREWRGEKTW